MSGRNFCGIGNVRNTERNTEAYRSVDIGHKSLFLLSLSKAFFKFGVGSGLEKKVNVCDVFPWAAT